LPKIRDPDVINAATVNDNKSRYNGGGNDKTFIIRNVDNVTEAGAVPFRPRIRNAKPNDLLTESGLPSSMSGITKLANA
jgi:hypothetical protein